MQQEQGQLRNTKMKNMITSQRDTLEDDFNINLIIQLENELIDKQNLLNELRHNASFQ